MRLTNWNANCGSITQANLQFAEPQDAFFDLKSRGYDPTAIIRARKNDQVVTIPPNK